MDDKPHKLRIPGEGEDWAMEIPLPEGSGDHLRGEESDLQEERYFLWRKIGRMALFATIFVVPILFLPFTQFPVEASKLTVVSVLLIVSLVSFFVCVMERRVLEYPRSLLALAVGIFTLVVGLGTLFSASHGLSLYGKLIQPDSFLATVLYALAFFLSFYFFTKEDLPKIGRIAVLSLAVATALGILQMYHVYLWPWGFAKATVFSTFGTTFGWGVFMVSVIVAAVMQGRGKQEEDGSKNKGLMVAAILMAVGLLVINYQFLWIALACVLLVIAAMRFMAHENFRVPIALVVVALFFAIVGSHLPTGAAQVTEVRPNLQSTWSIAGNTLHGWRLFFGSGPSTFSEQFARFRGQGLNLTNFWGAPFSQGYDFFLTLLTTTGVLGVLSFLFILFSLIRFIRRIRPISSFLLPLFFLAAMLFFYPGFFTLMLFLFIGFGLLLLSDEGARREISFENLKRPALFAVFIAAIAVCVFSLAAGYRIVEKYAAMAQYADAATALGSGNLTLAGSKIQNSISLDGSSDDAWRTGSQIAFAEGRQAFQQASGTLNAVAQAAISTALTAAQNAVRIDQGNVYNWEALGSVYEGLIPIANGADVLAVTAYQNAEKIDPWNPDLPVAIARVDATVAMKLAQSGQKDAAQSKLNDAEAQLAQSISLKPDYATPRFLLAQLYIQEGNANKAIQRIQEIESLNPLDAGLAFQLGLLYYQSNQIDEARQEFSRAVALDANYSNARYFLGLIDDQKGNHTDAIAQFEAIAKLNPDNAEIKQILSNLAGGKSALSGISPPAPAPAQRTSVPVPEASSTSGGK
jgi:cytochrome c-type biogenesis protein CcmH/NrfG